MKRFLTSYLEREIRAYTTPTHRGPGEDGVLCGTVLDVTPQHLWIRTRNADQAVSLEHLIRFEPLSPHDVPEDVVAPPADQVNRLILTEWFAELEAALESRLPEEQIRPRLIRILEGAERWLSQHGEDLDVQIFQERCEHWLRKCDGSG